MGDDWRGAFRRCVGYDNLSTLRRFDRCAAGSFYAGIYSCEGFASGLVGVTRPGCRVGAVVHRSFWNRDADDDFLVDMGVEGVAKKNTALSRICDFVLSLG